MNATAKEVDPVLARDIALELSLEGIIHHHQLKRVQDIIIQAQQANSVAEPDPNWYRNWAPPDAEE